jgi:hypothetical protein
MALAPGKIEINTEFQITIQFRDQDDVLIDPTTLVFRTRSPCGIETTYTYGTDSEIERLSQGSFSMTLAPNEGGVWAYRWQTTDPQFVKAGTFPVQCSPFSEFNTWGDYI